MRLAAPLLALLAAALAPPAIAGGKEPVLLVLPGPESALPFIFQLKGPAGEVLCTSGGYKKARAAKKAAHDAIKCGGDLKNYLFQKTPDAKGHYWEVRSKKHETILCKSAPVAEQTEAEHGAGVATKAFAHAAVTVK